MNFVNRVHQMANLGYWVRSTETGHGVASRAARMVARFGIEKLKFQRLEILAATGNLPSQRVAEKAGAVKEAVLHIGSWNSLHTGLLGSEGPTGRLWYESDFYAGLGLALGGGLNIGTTYTAYTSPNSSFSTVKELSFKASGDEAVGLDISQHGEEAYLHAEGAGASMLGGASADGEPMFQTVRADA